MRPRLLVLFALLTLAPEDANAGVFLGTVRSEPDSRTACTTTHPASNRSVIVNPYAILHPVAIDDHQERRREPAAPQIRDGHPAMSSFSRPTARDTELFVGCFSPSSSAKGGAPGTRKLEAR